MAQHSRKDETAGLGYADQRVLVRFADADAAGEAVAELVRQGLMDEGCSAQDVALGWSALDLADGASVSQALQVLEDSGLAEQLQPDFEYRLLETGDAAGRPTALAIGSAAAGASALSDDEFVGNNERWMRAIGVQDAWRLQPSASSVTVAVVDTGCNIYHADLKASVDAARGYNALTDTKGAAAVNDADGHGTHVAGIISATPNNGIGIAGIAGNARILPVKVIASETSSTSVLLKAYEYIMKLKAKDASIRVINMSLGGAGGYDPALLRAIDKAYYDYDILSVFAAGNDDEKTPYYCFPCDYAEVGLGVINVSGSTAENLVGKQDVSSNYNVGAEKTKDLCAPGEHVLSTYVSSGSSATGAGSPDSGYAYSSGTSMATPMVSAAAALVIAANPSLSAGKVKSILCSTAADVKRSDGSGSGFDAYTGYGLVQVGRAVAAARSGYLKGRDAVAVGGSITLSAPGGGTWKWLSGSKKVATVSQAGKVIGKSAGEVVVTAVNSTTGKRLVKTIVVYKVAIKGASSLKIGSRAVLQLQANPITLGAWKSSNAAIATVGATTGAVRAKKAGTVTITASLTAAPQVKVAKKIKVVKLANPMVAKARAKTASWSKLRSRAVVVKGAVTFSRKAKGAVTYAKVAKGSSGYLSINKKSGAVTVKKRTPRGTYSLRVRVKAAGNATYLARVRTLTLKVRVK